MNNTIRMNKKHIYTAPEVEVVMLQMESRLLVGSETTNSPSMTTHSADEWGSWE